MVRIILIILIAAAAIGVGLSLPPRAVRVEPLSELAPKVIRPIEPIEPIRPISPISLIELSELAPPPEILPAPAPAPLLLPAPAPQPILQSRAINLHTVVVLRCEFVNSLGRKKQAFGSGVIINSSGVILTARHVFDLEYAYQITGGNQGASGYDFQGCDVGQPPQGISAPAPEQIRSINPFTIVEVLPFRAEKFFVAGATGWSPAEINFIDIGLLKISGVNSDGSAFGVTSLPANFQFSPMLTNEIPADGEEIITFGFPSGNPQYGGRFFLQGSVGQITATIVGDKKFDGDPIGLQALMETIGGRSGSPVFWRGSVAGIVSSKEDYSINSTSISVVPLLRALKESGISL